MSRKVQPGRWFADAVADDLADAAWSSFGWRSTFETSERESGARLDGRVAAFMVSFLVLRVAGFVSIATEEQRMPRAIRANV